jgi:DNA-binding transcriptional MerR regulator
MNLARNGLLTIGAFAQAAQLSIKALRIYAALGLLAPSYIDPESGYRYYHTNQLQQARLIRLLRQIDMPLTAIRQVLLAGPAEAETIVWTYWQTREARVMQARQMVQNVIAYLRQEATMTFDVGVRTIEAQPIVSITKRVTVDQLVPHFQASLKTLYATVAAQGGIVSGVPFGIFHGSVNHEDDGPYELCVPVQRALTTDGEVVARDLTATQAASVMMQGEACLYPACLAGYDAAFDWIDQHGYAVAEAPRVIYHNVSGDDLCMEIVWPFREQAAVWHQVRAHGDRTNTPVTMRIQRLNDHIPCTPLCKEMVGQGIMTGTAVDGPPSNAPTLAAPR